MAYGPLIVACTISLIPLECRWVEFSRLLVKISLNGLFVSETYGGVNISSQDFMSGGLGSTLVDVITGNLEQTCFPVWGL